MDLRFGTHGLPLIGSGDWNDGMNLVGRHGKGESVWLGFFLCHVLGEFAKVARMRDDPSFADRCETEATQLRQRIEENAWDGAWYRRAYFDDGSALGSRDNAECQIDSVAQSWAVLSGPGNGARSRTAMNAVNSRLVRREHALIQLLDPPFDTSELEPGYIRGYVPGVRENGGQYTHGAIWAAMAFAALGEAERAWELTAMINPINHARTPEGAAAYKVEPYVVAADVYALAPHMGRGGWTWYTGSAGWMYRLVVESLLGLNLEADRLRFAPCLPPEWNELALRYRYRETYYRIVVRRMEMERDAAMSTVSVIVDGTPQPGNFVVLADDRQGTRRRGAHSLRTSSSPNEQYIRTYCRFPECGPYPRLFANGRPLEQLVPGTGATRQANPQCVLSLTGRVGSPANRNVRYRTDGEDEGIHAAVRSNGKLRSTSLVLCRIDSPSASGRQGLKFSQPGWRLADHLKQCAVAPDRDTFPMVEKEPLTVDVPREFHRRMAAVIDAVQMGMWQAGVHDLLGYATDFAFGQQRGVQTLVLKSKHRSAYVRLHWDTVMGDSEDVQQLVGVAIKSAINELT